MSASSSGKWFFLSTLVIVVGAVAIFLIYTLQWRTADANESSNETSSTNYQEEWEIARNNAIEVARFSSMSIVEITRQEEGIFKMRGIQGEFERCFLIDISNFNLSGQAKVYEPTFGSTGLTEVSCT